MIVISYTLIFICKNLIFNSITTYLAKSVCFLSQLEFSYTEEYEFFFYIIICHHILFYLFIKGRVFLFKLYILEFLLVALS